MMFAGKRILVGICGGIAIYRTAELVRRLRSAGAVVRCVMTRSACEFMSPLTFEALTGESVHTELFDLTSEREMGHIRLARWADAVIVAPATAHLIARMRHGIADDLLSTLLLACEAKVLLAPSMNVTMWQDASTQQNMTELSRRGIAFVGPESGELACGEEGAGRMAGPEQIMMAVWPLLCSPLLDGQRWLINAGPTQEPWDDVRILTNRASGKIGLYLAETAQAHGASVVLVAGPGVPQSSMAMERLDVITALEMFDACVSRAAGIDVFVATAAVSDYRFAHPCQGKIKREDKEKITVQMLANPDIVTHIAAMVGRPRKVIAFAAEREKHLEFARDKLKRKRADAIVANDAERMGSDTGGGWWVTPDEEIRLPAEPKRAMAARLLECIRTLGAGDSTAS